MELVRRFSDAEVVKTRTPWISQIVLVSTQIGIKLALRTHENRLPFIDLIIIRISLALNTIEIDN